MLQSTLRVILDEAKPGAVNMAIDEAILEAVNEGLSPATLRFYRWEEPTISLGYFQKYEELAEQEEAIRRLPVVRRQTGGGAILHDDELTYALILPIRGPEKESVTSIEVMYQIVHDAYIRSLERLGVRAGYRGGEDRGNAQRGPFFCFARRHRLDLVVGEDKLLGSAQRRVKKAVLQHGSLILGRHFPQQPSAAVAEAAEREVDMELFIRGVIEIIGEHLELKVVEGAMSEDELSRLGRLREKYEGDEWNQQR